MRVASISIIFIGLLLPGFVRAAEIRMMPTEIPIRVGQPVGIILNVDTPSEKANAFELDVQFDSTKLSYDSAADATAVTSFWIQYPHMCGEKAVCLAGMVPGGFVGLNQELATLYFIPKESGTTTLSVGNIRLLAHDGKGTAIPTLTTSIDVFVEEAKPASGGEQNTLDVEPPEPFKLIVSQDDGVEGGEKILIFSTKDKQSSVAAYYVKEYSFPLLKWLTPWTLAESPYRLKDQALKSTISVKAVDEAGNERIMLMQPKYPIYMTVQYLIGIFILFIIFIIIYRRRR
jgi:hypothetical protein